ncbi:CBS domain-containing protein [Nocardia sp. NPDC001965]
MTTVRQIMNPGAVSISVRDTMQTAAQQMRQRDVGALPICDGEGHPVGIVTDRDIVVNCVALGHHPATATAGEFAQGDELRTAAADDDVADALSVMERYQLRRLLVTDQGRLVGMVTEADIARNLPAETTGEFVGTVCEQKLPIPAESGAS